MLKKDIAILLGIAALLLVGAFVVPQLSTFARAPFAPAVIARSIMREIGTAPPSSACQTLLTHLRPLYTGLECRSHRTSASTASERINAIVHHYRARPTGGWQIGEAGLTRTYRNPEQSAPGAATQTLFVMVSNTLVVTGYRN